MYYEDNYGCFMPVLIIIGAFIAMAIIESVCNSVTDKDWNNGFCPVDHSRYELRAVSDAYIKYYSCPTCGLEVKRF